MNLNLSEPGATGYASSSADAFDWLGPLDGEVGRLFRAKDWSRTPLGPVEGWPQSLRMALSICLQSRFPMLIWWGPELVMLYNNAYRPMLGDKHPRSLGQDGRECWAEIWPVVGPLLAAVRERGEASWSEDQLLLTTRYGYLEETYFTFSYSPIRDETGGIGGIFTAVTETTSRVIGERRLNTLRNLSIVPKQIDVATASAAAAHVLGANPNDLPFALVYLASDDRQTARLAGAAGLAAGSELAPATIDLAGDAPFPIRDVLETGTARMFAPVPSPLAPTAMVLPLADPGRGDTTGVVVAGVSPRRPLDHDYETFLKLVATHVATAVSDARAYESERRRAEALAEIDRVKTTFFSNVSHEFRTPLTLMLGPLEEAIQAEGGSREALRVAHRNSLRLLKLVNSLLDFSRIEAGRIEASYAPTDLGAFTRDLASLFRSAVEKAGLTLVVDCVTLSEPVYVDRDMWEKIVFNLLSNALKFTFAGEIVVRLREGAAPGPVNGASRGPRRLALLEVADTGTGIPPEELPRVFDRFHRVRHARSRSHEGTGIGLALVQELTRLHGGRVTVESTVGVGTVFTVAISLGVDHLPPEKISAGHRPFRGATDAAPYVEEALRWLPGAGPGEDAAPPFEIVTNVPRSDKAAGAFVLVADDNSDMRDYLRRLLVARGYDVATVTDGAAALDAVRERLPALILSDVMMPKLDGLHLLQALRSDPATRSIPVILLTARAGEEARVEGVSAGADDYLTKPFAARELFARVETHLELARGRAATAQAVEAARRRLHDVFMQSPAMVCVLHGPEHVVELANDAYLQFVGRGNAAELVGKPLRTALPEIVSQGYLEILDRVFRTGEPFRGTEMRVQLARTADGQLEDGYVNFVYQPTRDTENVIDGVLVHAVDVTPQVRSRRQLEELTARSEQRRRLYDTVLSSTPDLVYVFGLDHRFIYANRALLIMWGRRAEDAIGRNCLELGYEPWHAAMHDREIEEVIATKRPVRGLVPFTGTHGRRIYDYIFVPVLNAEGTVEAVAGSTRDVTELKRKEDTLRFLVDLDAAAQSLSEPGEIMAQTAHMLGEQLGADRCAYAEVEDETVFVVTGDYPRGVPSIVGRWPVDAFGRTCLQVLRANEPYVVNDTDTDPRLSPSELVAYRTTMIRSVICVPLHKAGKFTAALAVHQSTPRVWTKEEFELVRLVAARCWESLERARALRRLQENEQRLRFLAESMPQKMFTATAHGDVDYANPQWSGFAGVDAGRLLGAGWIEILHPDERAENARRWEHAVATGEPFTAEHRFRRHDGEYRWHLTRAVAFRDAAGQIQLWIGSATEIEAQKRTEEELERIVAERTAKLRETIGELEAFSYSIAHDLRAPLRALQGFSDVLLTDHAPRLDAEARGFLARIAAAGGRMDRLIQDVLNYSRVIRGESELGRVDVAALLHGILETYPAFAPDQARIEMVGAFPPVVGNEAMLMQVFSNLLGNAVKFVAPGVKPHIRLWTQQQGERVRISIRDNGIGVDPEQHRKIFEIFQQAETGYGGTGIGLAIVKKAIERMGGTVSVESALGAGSTFTLDLRRAEPRRGPPRANPPSVPLPSS